MPVGVFVHACLSTFVEHCIIMWKSQHKGPASLRSQVLRTKLSDQYWKLHIMLLLGNLLIFFRNRCNVNWGFACFNEILEHMHGPFFNAVVIILQILPKNQAFPYWTLKKNNLFSRIYESCCGPGVWVKGHVHAGVGASWINKSHCIWSLYVVAFCAQGQQTLYFAYLWRKRCKIYSLAILLREVLSELEDQLLPFVAGDFKFAHFLNANFNANMWHQNNFSDTWFYKSNSNWNSH